MNAIRLLACSLLLLASGAPAGTTREWNFTAYLDDSRIGYHRFLLTEHDGQRELVSEARFNVKFLFINAYRYAHDDRERWRGDCLVRIAFEVLQLGVKALINGGTAPTKAPAN